MKPVLLKSQFDALETPKYGIEVCIAPTPREIVKILWVN